MRVVIAPDSFKESLPAIDVASAIADGVKRVSSELEIDCVPMADGGEGTVDAIVSATGGEFVHASVSDPLGRPIRAKFGLTGDGRTAVMEMAAASGLQLLTEQERDPLVTSTFGTGQLILAAVERGVEEIILGIGGSATVDGGAGMAQALGLKFKDDKGSEIGPGGAELLRIAAVDASALEPRLKEMRVKVACDVTNPLLGPEGAAAVYAPQKGALPADVGTLERALNNLADIAHRELNVGLDSFPGSGAAGGLGGGLAGFLGAELVPGVQLVIETVKLSERIKGADLVFTGEGRLDNQSAFGKTPLGVAETAAGLGVPVIALVGELGDGWKEITGKGLTAALSIVSSPMSLETAKQETRSLLADTAEQVLRIWLSGSRGKSQC